MHISSGRWAYGLFLALLTAFLWGILPIKLKQVLLVMDPVTVTWFRLLVSGGCLFIYLAAVKRLPSSKVLGPKGGWLVLMAVLVVQVGLLNAAPQSAYFAITLQSWEQGRFIHFHGLAQWVGWLWPYVVFVYLAMRLGKSDGGQPRILSGVAEPPPAPRPERIDASAPRIDA